jgi:4-hydroxybenzoate polyprenyltransferase
MIRGYIEIARVDHWFKNVFMLFGVMFALFHYPDILSLQLLPNLIVAFAAACLIASSNYVLNEIKDAPYDSIHPQKKHRAIPSGRVKISLAYVEWIFLAAIGFLLAAQVNRPFLFAIIWLFLMGILYNVRPFRLKDLLYIDVLSESVNNPIRLLLGWFAVISFQIPSISLLISYWLIGAFFMTSKRFAEFRHINDKNVAGNYRKSFRQYTDKSLLMCMFFYATGFALFFGIFIIKYHIELIISAPLIAGFICYYVFISFKENSAAQNPERLYREKGLIIYAVVCLVVFILLLFTSIPVMYEWFNVSPPQVSPLWTFKD